MEPTKNDFLAVKQKFRQNGVTVKSWAEAKGFNVKLAYDVINGRAKCIRGEYFEIGKALGLCGNGESFLQ